MIRKKGKRTVSDEQTKRKYPIHLVLEETGSDFEKEAYYIVVLAKTSYTYYYLIGAGLGVLALSMITVWPLWLKLAVWWASYIFLLFMVFF